MIRCLLPKMPVLIITVTLLLHGFAILPGCDLVYAVSGCVHANDRAQVLIAERIVHEDVICIREHKIREVLSQGHREHCTCFGIGNAIDAMQRSTVEGWRRGVGWWIGVYGVRHRRRRVYESPKKAKKKKKKRMWHR
ncbi:hypothetical protein F4780DRAFT_71495 [Xylariomycetidae sp. FL0641]|nr:hypothetical protein F4780DRAFT_71495 [Xylariomycetidae sp. FL0641]